MKLIVPERIVPARVLTELGDMLVFMREHRNWTQKQVAEMCMHPLITYQSWERGIRTPNALTLGFLVRLIQKNIPEGVKITDDDD